MPLTWINGSRSSVKNTACAPVPVSGATRRIQIEKPARLSKITVILGAYIVISASFMLQARNWLFKTFGGFVVITSFKAFFLLLVIITVAYALKIRLSIFRIGAISFIFILGYLLIMWQEHFSEKTHVLTYGLLGYLAAKDLIKEKGNPHLKHMALAVIFVSFVSALDEIFQGLLPYRYAELKDFITNIISGALGTTLFLALKKQRRFPA